MHFEYTNICIYLKCIGIVVDVIILQQMMMTLRQLFVQIKQLLPTAPQQVLSLMAPLSQPQLKELLAYRDIQSKTLMFFLVGVTDETLSIELFNKFVEVGGDVKAIDTNKQSIVYYLAKENKAELLKKVLTYKFDLNQNDYFNQTPLFYSAKHNKTTESVALLLDYGCDPNHKDNNGQTALYYAASAGAIAICRMMLDRGCNPQHTDANRQKAINYAKRSGHYDIVQLLTNAKLKERQMERVRQPQHVKIEQHSSQNIPSNQIQSSERPHARSKKINQNISKSQYVMMYTNEDGQSCILTLQQIEQFRKANDQNAKLYQMMQGKEEGSLERGIDKRWERLAMKVLMNFWKSQSIRSKFNVDGFYFHEPVNWVVLNMPDYPKIIRYPMDFTSIKTKLSYNGYSSQAEFQGDMNLIFDNCILYHGSAKGLGKIALQMKMQFNTMWVKQCSGI